MIILLCFIDILAFLFGEGLIIFLLKILDVGVMDVGE